MTKDAILKNIRDKFGKRILKIYDKSAKRVYIDIDRKDIVEMTRFIFKDLGARFNIATALDNPDNIEMMYHFDFDAQGLIVTIRAYVPKSNCEIDSILPVMKGAEWIEREIYELFGVGFKGHPDIKPLLLPDNWPRNQHPMRKDYKLNEPQSK